MRKLGVSVLALAAAILLAAPAAAQQRGGFGMGATSAMLLGQKSVREELKLTEEQIKKADELGEKLRSEGQAFRQELRDLSPEERQEKIQARQKEQDKAIGEILKPEQVKRLKQISYQQIGPLAAAGGPFGNKEIEEAIKLNDEQKQKFQELGRDMFQAMQELRQSGASPEESRTKMTELRKSTNEKAIAALTDEQKAKWKELTGEPFKGEIVFRRPGQ